jgi:integrase
MPPDMGRKPSRPNAVPRLRLRKRGKVTYYFYDAGGKPRKEIPLGTSYPDAIRKWSDLECATPPGKVLTFTDAADEYRKHVIPKKRASTAKVNLREMRMLLKFFGEPPLPLAAMRPLHVAQYWDWRTQRDSVARHSATREIALLSHLWNKCRAWGYTDAANPCRGIERAGKSQRQVYVEDDVLGEVYKAACAPLRDAMDLAYLTGQRPADTLAMDAPRDGMLHIRQGKTGARLRLTVQGELAVLIERIRERKRGYRIVSTRLVVDDKGRALTRGQLRYRFDQAREKAGIAKSAFQFRDLRAKAATDKAEAVGIRDSQRQLGHASVTTTEGYVRNRRGEKVTPTR